MQQIDLASTIGTTQQTVSRWEAGTSRPPRRQIEKLANALKMNERTLLEAAGYPFDQMSQSAETSSLDHAFPVDALSPESFERFIEYLLHHLYPDAKEIRRAGKSGHTQGGIDILVVESNGKRSTFQCKRVTRFGPRDVEEAVRCHTEQAEHKHLIISRVASPQTSAAIRQFPDWTLWDKEDIARLVRKRLTKIDQIQLVDTYFPGQRLPLLGVPPPGAWQTPEEFFAPFAGRHATFSHDWPLIGRTELVENIVNKLSSGSIRIMLLTGAGGIGKTRILKQVVDQLREAAPNLNPLFLSNTEIISAQSLDLLIGRPRVIVVDDAHDRTDLPALFAFAASHPEVRIVLASRPYAKTRLRGQAAMFALADEIGDIEVVRLNLRESTQLATEVLEGFGGDRAWAEPIAQATQDCPLVTVMAARIAVNENLPLGLAQNTQSFRDTILGKFAKIITGELAPPGDQKIFTEILKIISLIQPFGMNEIEFRTLTSQITGLDDNIISSTLRTLAEGGIIIPRGNEYRLMPDLLGDYIIEQTCIDIGDRLNSFAEKVFEVASGKVLGRVLVNLGRLDWRRNGGDPSKSHLLTHLWRALEITEKFHDSALEAAAAASFYQPAQAIEFVTRVARKGLRRDELTKILRHAAYNLEYVDEVCSLLWELGRADDRELSRFPDHPIRCLKELCAVGPNKPVDFNEKVVSFGVSLLDDKKSFGSNFTPFDFLRGILSGAGETSESNSRIITFKPFEVVYDAVKKLRANVIDSALQLVQGNCLRASVKAADFLGDALRYPMVPFNGELSDETRQKYTVEFRDTLGKIEQLASKNCMDPLVLIAIIRATAWHANYADSSTSDTARLIRETLPDTLEFRTLSALVDGYGRIFLGRFDINTWQTRVTKFISDITSDLAVAYPNAATLRRFLEGCLTRIADAKLDSENSAGALIEQILRTRPDFALELVENGLQSPDSKLSIYLGRALFFVLHSDKIAGQHFSRRFLDSGNIRLQVAVGIANNSPELVDGQLSPEDTDILIRVIGSSNRNVVRHGLPALGALAQKSPRIAIDLMRHANFKSDPRLVDEVFMLFHTNRDEVLRSLTEDDVRFILSELKALPELDGHWVETLLSYLSLNYADQTCSFFLERADMAASNDENFTVIRPINYGPWVHIPLQFKESVQYPDILERVWSWLCAHDATNWRFEHHAAAIFEGMFLPIDNTVIAYLYTKLVAPTKHDLRWMAVVLSHTNSHFVFENQAFVEKFLQACALAGQPVQQKGIDALFRGAISGLRSGRPGEPFPQDLQIISSVEAILPGLPRLSPAYELYDQLRRHAERGIEFQKQQAEFFDDE